MPEEEDLAEKKESEPAIGRKSVRRNPAHGIVFSSDSEIDRHCDKTLRLVESTPDECAPKSFDFNLPMASDDEHQTPTRSFRACPTSRDVSPIPIQEPELPSQVELSRNGGISYIQSWLGRIWGWWNLMRSWICAMIGLELWRGIWFRMPQCEWQFIGPTCNLQFKRYLKLNPELQREYPESKS